MTAKDVKIMLVVTLAAAALSALVELLRPTPDPFSSPRIWN